MKVAIMQPYVFPYLGYFQLIEAVDTFVFYDDVNFIKKGFIHRNNLLYQGNKTRFTIPCKGISQNKKINEILIDTETAALNKLLISIEQHYKQAPFFKSVISLLRSFINTANPNLTIAQFAIDSVQLVASYLELDTKFIVSSKTHASSLNYGREERLIDITKKEGGTKYINSINGKELYSKDSFKKHEVDLCFLQSQEIKYNQFNNEFVPWLSIIDVMMFNSKENIKHFLKTYTLQ